MIDTINLPGNISILIMLSGGLTLFLFRYWLQMATAVIPATISMNQKFVKENLS